MFFEVFCLIFSIVALAEAYLFREKYLLSFLCISGVIVGIYYGKNNYELYHSNNVFEEEPRSLKVIARIDAFLKHILCGIMGSVALYVLIEHLNIFSANHQFKLDWSSLILFIIAMLGYLGLLPLTFTFLAASGKLLEKILKQ